MDKESLKPYTDMNVAREEYDNFIKNWEVDDRVPFAARYVKKDEYSIFMLDRQTEEGKEIFIVSGGLAPWRKAMQKMGLSDDETSLYFRRICQEFSVVMEKEFARISQEKGLQAGQFAGKDSAAR